ncbi:para-nitrobenzyl esterase [Melanomma pulvis-pyrius CBS 109.77]|uniref:Carboxylic ester hydrolase n=1 Tax=Melanomma pulvis-pyrius CBS 109.77 TaxID=1314802 RepID=A0A6A6X830_9PLEO|nr:para-nitrobenzyl esterase [Melanomma pulvis-pyrius CBS 109.77]
MVIVLGLLLAILQLQPAYAVSSLTIETTSGPVTGLINGTTPNVAQFLGIPYAEPPVRERRWLPSILKSREDHIDATRFGQNCPQFEGNASNIWNTDAPEFNIPGNPKGENCLFANVWAPWNSNNTEKLPVIAWIYGGGFQSGGGDVEYQIPSRWIERSQKHIVVGINYRVNIFGFPNAAGLNGSNQNLGLLDQRLGMEWVRSNIANFGGDPARITLWGQSSGAMSVDYFNFAYPEDPIVSGLIITSGSALLPLGFDTIADHSNFTYVANHFSCNSSTPQIEIDCLRNVSSSAIISFLKDRADAGTPSLAFNPVVDNRTKFANFTARALAGNYTKKPAIIGTNVNEGEGFLPYNRIYGPDITAAHAFTLSAFLCPIVKSTSNRYATGVPTFRYLYGGNFSNIAPQWWEGAYHAAQLPLVFGTHGIVRGASTPFETQVSMKMQDYWLAFAEDPVAGLPALGWEKYSPDGDAVLIGREGVVTQPIAESRLEDSCDGENPKPGASPPP